MSNTNLSDILRYSADESESSDSDTETVSSSKLVAHPRKFDSSSDEGQYDSDDQNDTNKLNSSNIFRPLLDYNIITINQSDNSILIGLTQKQRIFISGIFNLQVVKGGIVYNNVHYNASKKIYTVWHPLSNSIPSINSSHYAGWEESLHLPYKYKNIAKDRLDAFPCILKINNSNFETLLEVCNLFPESRYLWKLKNGTNQSFSSDTATYDILNKDIDPFIPLEISQNWVSVIEKLNVAHKNSQYDMRVLALGGKNSGKSTFLRLLRETFNNTISENQIENDMLYLDFDPGQCEVSEPECISLSKLKPNNEILGNSLSIHYQEMLDQIYIGSSSPQDMPSKYLEAINSIIQSFEDQSFMGTSLLNLPGWIKGFGLNIINHVINSFKPTHIILLESNSTKSSFSDLVIPDYFSSDLNEHYQPIVYNILANTINSNNSPTSKFQANQIRTYKMITYMHTIQKSYQGLKFDFNPLISKAPIQVSFGEAGIRGFQFTEEFRKLNENDIKGSLEGTIVALHSLNSKELMDITYAGKFPLIDNEIKDKTYISLLLIHSIDVEKKLMNIYIPDHKLGILKSNCDKIWIIVRNKTETPIQELYSDNLELQNATEIPYISTERRKKYEHVWKVRKNVLRRGHHMK
ncbi:hypothetical protein Kpol_1044p14 [Vanderwaltozyma polyspora DSM 70294]|uniref:Polynucleotide 5'-hydroxyl-kinase GRC3 n=1 Tax=Vanderwaltozyma polyspora (strain ATCC 22028 / DSM 70294 / BCRC 21397 / CBS 2163 / NBRC 10782 / NRRL Y-8283 / UCD 57-17) TaxID=436907 RepID=A7TP45_VANPO|nr:uncharacterized protein Kpol_1044p14 [Vanderwaltozyma polyspora DSM 70294]EDO15955.1 hypothetical protein Kpol_1044p14 [Vanderwaltozyma polyspora DSM 70294]